MVFGRKNYFEQVTVAPSISIRRSKRRLMWFDHYRRGGQKELWCENLKRSGVREDVPVLGGKSGVLEEIAGN